MLYKKVIKPVLFRIDPEVVHKNILPLGRVAGATAPGRAALSTLYGYAHNDAEVVVDGVRYHTPVVLSAGFDPNGMLTQTLGSVGFGGEEVGSVTARPCTGNPPPNQVRLPHTKSLIVNKGLRNEGVVAVTKRLKKAKRIPGYAVGVSIARTNDTETCTLEGGIEDYATSFTHLIQEGVGDWYTINISCPNTHTGELFLDPDNLDLLLTTLDRSKTTRPVYLKMPISVGEARFRALADVGAKHNVQGLIIGNLQKNYDHIDSRDTRPATYSGGLSGAPCKRDADHLLTVARETYDDRFTLIGCGGVLTVEDAMEKFDRGAKLIHLITGMIFTGPSLMGDIAKAYAKRKIH